ncbi:MAG: potassium-transporting ATPase subunit KdpA, partial [Bacillota bacterium]
ENIGPVAPDLAFNTAVSFMTNTNWQAYSGETTMSYFTQMAGLTVQNFLSAASGLAAALALIRGLTRKTTQHIGSFWVDLVRSVLWVFLPLCFVYALVLVQQGVLQNLLPYQTITTLEGVQQKIAMGPVASQEAIKMLGVNGGGFFNTNSAHPFENPTPFTNFLQILSIFLVPVGLVFTYGHMARDRRQGYVVLAAMLLMFVLHLGVVYTSEMYGNPLVKALGITGSSVMEGKEVRFGVGGSALFATVTTAASCGAVNTMHDSLTPLGGLIALLQMMLGEVVLGGVGAGFYSMMMYIVLTVFIVGLMVGRTPEYLGKKIEAWEMKMATVAVVVIPAAAILLFSAVATVTAASTAATSNPAAHGLSEIIYAYSSAVGNNGSAFAGLSANNPFYNLTLAIAMLIGRFGVIIPVLAVAGSLAEKKIIPAGPGTFRTTSILFIVLLTGVVWMIGALTFFPALALGPVVEQLQMLQRKVF